jgi:formyl-CoA transferase
VTLSRTPGRLHRRAPTVGEHTDMILRRLGFDDADIGDLRAAGTV